MYFPHQVGTSSIVYPAAAYGRILASRGIPCAEFNLTTTPVTELLRYNFCIWVLPRMYSASFVESYMICLCFTGTSFEATVLRLFQWRLPSTHQNFKLLFLFAMYCCIADLYFADHYCMCTCIAGMMVNSARKTAVLLDPGPLSFNVMTSLGGYIN